MSSSIMGIFPVILIAMFSFATMFVLFIITVKVLFRKIEVHGPMFVFLVIVTCISFIILIILTKG